MNPISLLLVTLTCLVLTAQGLKSAVKIPGHKHGHGHGNSAAAADLEKQIEDGMRVTEQAIQKTKEFMSLPSNKPYTVQCYEVCLETYNSAMDDWKGAVAALKARKAYDMQSHLSAVSSNIATCNDAFTNDDPTVENLSPIAGIGKEIGKLNSESLRLGVIVFPELKKVI